MKWRCLAAFLVGLAGGCQADAPVLPPPGNSPQSVSRLQKDERPDPKSVSPVGLRDTTSQLPEIKDGQVVATVRAVVNGVPILESEVRNACIYALAQTNSLPEPDRSQKQKEVLDKALDLLIERELVLQDANEKLKGPGKKYLDKVKEAADREFEAKIVKAIKAQYNAKTEEEFKDILSRQGVSLDNLRKSFQKQFVYQEYMRSRVGPAIERIGAQQIRDYYEQHPDEFQQADSADWLDIFIPASGFGTRDEARQFAEQLLARAQAGEEFLTLVRQYDRGDSSYRNGEGHGHRRGEIQPPEVEPYLFSLKDGDLAPLVEIGNGFHIVKLVKREYAGRMAFDEKTQAKIRMKLQGEVFTKEAKRVVSDLKRRAAIEIAPTP